MEFEQLLAPLQGRAPFPSDGALRFSGSLSLRDLRALVAELTDNPQLRSLTLRGCHIDDEGADLLSRVVAFNTALEHLDLSGNAIGSQGAQLLANALKIYNSGALKSLCLADNPCVAQMPDLFPGNAGTLGPSPAAAGGAPPSPLRPVDAQMERRRAKSFGAWLYFYACGLNQHARSLISAIKPIHQSTCRLLHVEQGLEATAEQLSGVLAWRARFDSASEQMAAVLEMLQTDAEALR